jgi:DNA-3-methyladenine glycosylase
MEAKNKIDKSFYTRDNVVRIARNLLGKVLCTRVNGEVTKGMIVESEAYSYKERACHAYKNRRTKRTSVMFEEGGLSYVYLIYGIHNLFNIVTNKNGVAEAVLIRAVQPLEGISTMLRRRGLDEVSKRITAGPGVLSNALGINLKLNGKSLLGNIVWIENSDFKSMEKDIVATKRIGVSYAKEDSNLPWRFYLKDNPWVSVK